MWHFPLISCHQLILLVCYWNEMHCRSACCLWEVGKMAKMTHWLAFLLSMHSPLCVIATRLLQLTVVLSAMLNYSASAACHECSSSSYHELVVVRPRKPSAEAATLATSWAKNYLQAVSVHAPHPQRISTTILRLCIHSFCSQSQIPAEVDWLSGLHSA